jgi:parallel beta-helix repeat protein
MLNKNKILIAIAFSLTLTACEDYSLDANGNALGTINIEGEAVFGDILTATLSDGNGITNSNVSYVWLSNGVPVSGANAMSYTVAESDIGNELSVSVSYTDDDGYSESIISGMTDAVPTPAVNFTGMVTVTGTAVEEQTLMTSVVDDNGIDGEITFQWFAGTAEISGATADSYLLTSAEVGTEVTVVASYTDNDEFIEAITSPPVMIEAKPPATVNVAGAATFSASQFVIGTEVSAVVADPNGFTTGTSQWFADGVAIADATNIMYTPTLAEVGKSLSVQVIYSDTDGYAEDVMASTDALVYSYIVTNEADFIAAVAGLVEGDWIALDSAAGGDYADMAEISVTVNNVTLTNVPSGSATITGATCITLSGDNAMVNGLMFEETNIVVDSACDADGGNSSLFINASNATVKNSTFLGDIATDEYAMLASKGNDNLIERNEFSGRNMELKSAALVIFNNADEDSQERTTVQYNHFKDMGPDSGDAGDRRSDASAIQVGRSTGSDSTGAGEHLVQYNLFDNVIVDKRVMRVQSSNSTIKGNTIINSTGMISVEDGAQNTVTENIIIPVGDDSDDGGISFTTMAHTITHNYVENSLTTSGDRAALFLFSDPIDNSGNEAITAAGIIELVTVIANNTVINSRHGFGFDDKNCAVVPPTLDVDSNFIANESTNDNGNSSEAVAEGDFVDEPCTFNSATDYDANEFYAKDISDIDANANVFTFNGGSADNTTGARDEAVLTTNAQDLKSGATANVGADVTKLYKISSTEIGPNSTWVR